MNQGFENLLLSSSKEEILEEIASRLDKSEEAPFWKEKIVPFVDAILSVLLPLREQNILFSPEGRIQDKLSEELFYSWTDLISLRTLAFIIEQCNDKNTLIRTDYKDVSYEKVDLEVLGKYLSSYKVNLTDEDSIDFPVGNYNLHIGMITIIKTLF